MKDKITWISSDNSLTIEVVYLQGRRRKNYHVGKHGLYIHNA